MSIIKKKISPEYFDLIASGKKKYEFRMADFEVAEGDTLILEECDPKTRIYTGRSITKKVGYTKKFTIDDFGQRDLILKNGFYIIQLE
ncbi:MAG: hypothetical protein RLZZ347_443 [Candidatus Parcubacteria bacterium]